ncbi:MAG: hypothetical protein IT379_14860 [Deltaproteobacteria bacterium]|nr:hypothetical protein [Deltaproteobacteria bacterium]
MAYEGLPFLVVSAHADAPAVVRQMRRLARRPVEHAATRSKAEAAWRGRPLWAGLVVDASLSPATSDGLALAESVRRDAPHLPLLILAAEPSADCIHRTATLGATLAWSPPPLDIVGAFMRRAMEAHALSDGGGLDPRVARALDAEILAASPRLASLRAAELLRFAVAGLTPQEIELSMKIGTDCYAYHVRRLLRGTRAPDIQTLVLRVLRNALRMSPTSPELANVRPAATDGRDLSGIRDRRTGRWIEPTAGRRGAVRGR